jgi:hypothetical protein
LNQLAKSARKPTPSSIVNRTVPRRASNSERRPIAGSLQLNALLSEQLQETRVDRERWRGQAQQLVAALAAPVTKSKTHPRRHGFVARLMGLV